MRSQSRRSGFVLITMAAGALALTGALGLAFDVGRMYIAKSELQTFADAASLAAALRLNGEASGIARARDEVEAMRLAHKWNLAADALPESGVEVRFAQSFQNGPPVNWSADPGVPAGYSFAKVTASGAMPIYFMAAVRGATSTTIAASATAGQLPLPPDASPQGLFPFTPIAHSPDKPDFGMTPGVQYTLRWASSPKFNGKSSNICAGDNDDGIGKWVELATLRGAENRGFYGSQSNASLIKEQVANDTPVEYYREGSTIVLTGGAKTTVTEALLTRIAQDHDPTSASFAAYRGAKNTRRITTVPVTDARTGKVYGFARFFLLPAAHYANAQGNDPWCAEYIGPGAPERSDDKGANPEASVTRVRLWE